MEKLQETTSSPERVSSSVEVTSENTAPIIFKFIERSPEDLQKIEQIRHEFGLEASTSLSLLEGISLDNFDVERLEIIRSFYMNRETRSNVVNPDLHLRNSDRLFTRIRGYVRDVQGKAPFTKNIEVASVANFEKGEDFSLHYFDTQHEVEPVYGEVAKGVGEFIGQAQSEGKNMQVFIEKKDYETFTKKVVIGGNVVQEISVPIETNTLWQALKHGKFEIDLSAQDAPLTHAGGGGGETVGVWAKVTGSLSDWQGALGRLELLTVHEYSHVNQVAVDPKAEAFSSTLNYKRHATHPTEIQARVHEAIHFARKNQADFDTALRGVMERYFKENKDRILKEKGAEDVVRNEAPRLHKEYFEKHYGQIKSLYGL